MKIRQKSLDIAIKKQSQLDTGMLGGEKPAGFKSVLFSRGKKTEAFFTEDSRLYITPREYAKIATGIKLDRKINKWDSLSSRVVNEFVYHKPTQTSILLDVLEDRLAIINESANVLSRDFLGQFSIVRLWNLSIVCSVLFGMMTMTFVYRYFGQGASANQLRADTAQQQVISQDIGGKILGAQTSEDAEAFAKEMLNIQQAKSQKELEKDIKDMVKGYPIEKMVPYIAEQDRTVAAFIVAIARKESSWGVHVPVLNGKDCYNYWGIMACSHHHQMRMSII